MPLDDRTIGLLRGDLSDEDLARVDWDRLQPYVQEAVLGQRHHVRKVLLDAGLSPYDLSPFRDGWTVISWQGNQILRLHVSRLFRDNPIRRMDMTRVGDREK